MATPRRARNPFFNATKEIDYEHQLAGDSESLSFAYLNHRDINADVFELVAQLEEELGHPLNPHHPESQS